MKKTEFILIIVILAIAVAAIVFAITCIFIGSTDSTISDYKVSSKDNSTVYSNSENDTNTIDEDKAIVSSPETISSNTSTSSIVQSSTPSYNPPVTSSSPVVSSLQSETTSSENFEAEQRLFKQLYSLAETQYKAEINSQISSYEIQLNDWRDKQEQYTKQKYAEQVLLAERYANMGLTNSGQYTTALNGLNNKYNSLIKECSSNINSISSKISMLEQEKQNPDPNKVLAIVANTNGMSPSEVFEKYNKYIT